MPEPPPPFDWDELLLFIRERRVIPIIGDGLRVALADSGEEISRTRLAMRLAERLGIPQGRRPAPCTLNSVAMVYQELGGDRAKVYSSLKLVLESESPQIPESLKQLAGIAAFSLFVTTSFDPLLAQAIDEARHAGAKRTQVLAYSPHGQPQDLPAGSDALALPTVFHIFGVQSSSPNYVVTDEDALEFLHTLQLESKRPTRLFDELRRSHLLFLGCDFPDWLARFFVRTMTNQRLILPRDGSQIVADDMTRSDANLALFLTHYKTSIYLPGGARAFVQELHDRWSAMPGVASAEAPNAEAPDSIGEGSIFISYAREDAVEARALRDALNTVGLDAWLDERRLEPGDAWAQKIEDNIRRCTLFVPVLSRRAQQRREGFFREEWTQALQRARRIDERYPFIQPIIVDELGAKAQGIPDGFWARQVTRAPGGIPSRETLEQIRSIVRGTRDGSRHA